MRPKISCILLPFNYIFTTSLLYFYYIFRTMSSTQIAFSLPNIQKKKLLQKKLASEGLTTKAFFSFCVDGYLAQSIKIGIIPSDTYENISPTEHTHLKSMKHIDSLLDTI